MERISKYRDTVEFSWPKASPLTIVFGVCLALSVVALIYVLTINPAVDAGVLAGR